MYIKYHAHIYLIIIYISTVVSEILLFSSCKQCYLRFCNKKSRKKKHWKNLISVEMIFFYFVAVTLHVTDFSLLLLFIFSSIISSVLHRSFLVVSGINEFITNYHYFCWNSLNLIIHCLFYIEYCCCKHNS